MKRNTLLFCTLIIIGIISPIVSPSKGKEKKKIVAYVTSWSRVMPNPRSITHLNYAFGHVAASFDNIRIDNPERLHSMAILKQENKGLKVMLSIGGWGSGNFSEMAANDSLRLHFAQACRRVVESYSLDGIDIDWEYPTSSAAGISASKNDTENFTLLMRDIREALGKDKLLTLASSAWAGYINFKDIMPYIDFVNVMAYDMASAPKFHCALYDSERAGEMTASKAIERHKAQGVEAKRLVLGVPFYGRGAAPYQNFVDYKNIYPLPEGCNEAWDNEAKAPYVTNKEGLLICGYDNPKSLKLKCRYVKHEGLGGVMFWDLAGDNEEHALLRTLAKKLHIK